MGSLLGLLLLLGGAPTQDAAHVIDASGVGDGEAAAPGEPPPSEVAASASALSAAPSPAPAATAASAAHAVEPAVELHEGHFGAIVLRGTSSTDSLGMMVGLRGAVILERSWSFGLAGYYTVVEPKAAALPFRNDRYLRMGYGGLEIGCELGGAQRFHGALRALAAAGGISHRSRHVADVVVGPDLFFVLEPGADLVVSVVEALRLTVGLSYRFAYGVDLEGFGSPAGTAAGPANGLSLDLALQLGAY